MRLHNETTGATVDVSEETAKLLGSDYKPADSDKKPTASKKAAAARPSADSDKK